MCRKPLGSGGKRVVTGRPKRPVATSSSTSSRMKLLRGVVSLDTDSGDEGLPEYSRGVSRSGHGRIAVAAYRDAGVIVLASRRLSEPLASALRRQTASTS